MRGAQRETLSERATERLGIWATGRLSDGATGQVGWGGMMMCSVIIRAVVGSCPSAHARWERFRARVAQRRPEEALSGR